MDEICEHAAGLWTFHQPLSVLGAEIGCRMTVIRLSDGELLVHSPIRLEPQVRHELEALGGVGHVLAPNFDHYLFARDYKVAFPTARFYAAPGVAPKLPEVQFDEVLEYPRTIAAWEDTLDQRYFRSSDELQELVLFHRATNTLISADLAFNIQTAPSLLSKALLLINDSYNTFGPSRACRRHITKPDLCAHDLEAILRWAPERLVVAHGEILFSGAAEALRDGYAWLLRA